MKFVKSHGLGNDYIVIDGKKLKKKLSKKTIINICDRNFGIGSDGILILEKSKRADFKLIISLLFYLIMDIPKKRFLQLKLKVELSLVSL